LSYKLALSVLPIFESIYPENKRVRECLKAIQKLKSGEITIEELRTKRCASHANIPYSVAYASLYTTYYAASAYIAPYSAYNTVSAALASAVVSAAFATKNNPDYRNIVLQVLIDFVNEN
jgi:hypothetical protein